MRPDERRKLPAPGAKPGMPQYTKADVAKHAAVGDRVWITYKDGVYDITDFIEAHPGGQVGAARRRARARASRRPRAAWAGADSAGARSGRRGSCSRRARRSTRIGTCSSSTSRLALRSRRSRPCASAPSRPARHARQPPPRPRPASERASTPPPCSRRPLPLSVVP